MTGREFFQSKGPVLIVFQISRGYNIQRAQIFGINGLFQGVHDGVSVHIHTQHNGLAAQIADFQIRRAFSAAGLAVLVTFRDKRSMFAESADGMDRVKAPQHTGSCAEYFRQVAYRTGRGSRVKGRKPAGQSGHDQGAFFSDCL